MDLVERVLDFWYAGNIHEKRKAWFVKDPAFDDEIRHRFGTDVERAAAGQHDGLADSAEGALALLILLDQFPRNIYRNDPQTFAADGKALAVAKAAIAQGHDAGLTPFQRIFFYLPFEHSEDLVDQERAVELCTGLGDADYLKYAIAHRDVIARFGRFPHRNVVLGRQSSDAEIEFMKTFNAF
ncbi:MAG: DUF924 domain-containing protein [Rhodospirillales bacterium]|nr:DUF924 domain-containing protein [Rhodospirillales bacterium]